MNFAIADKDLLGFFTDESGPYSTRLSRRLADNFFDAMDIIARAASTRDLASFRSLNFEKLKGDLQGLYSIRLDRQFRLLPEVAQTEDGDLVVVIKLTDYH